MQGMLRSMKEALAHISSMKERSSAHSRALHSTNARSSLSGLRVTSFATQYRDERIMMTAASDPRRRPSETVVKRDQW